jgi:hypothetical protein
LIDEDEAEDEEGVDTTGKCSIEHRRPKGAPEKRSLSGLSWIFFFGGFAGMRF